MPGPTWLYAQVCVGHEERVLCIFMVLYVFAFQAFDDSWNSWDGQVRQPDAAEMAVSIMSAVAAGGTPLTPCC